MNRTRVLLVIAYIGAALSACALCGEGTSISSLPETPQTFVLTTEEESDSMYLMPTVTLYENGNARLSQPPISSLAITNIGRYERNGSILRVAHQKTPFADEGFYASLTVSNDGNTLTLQSSNLLFTEAGLEYKYRPSVEYLKQFKHVGGETFTLEGLRELIASNSAITFADFYSYAHWEVDQDKLLLEVGEEYTLDVTLGNDGCTHAMLERRASGEYYLLYADQITAKSVEDFDYFISES